MEIINLDMVPSTVTPNAHAGQYDSARTVRFMLKNGGAPFTLAGTETIVANITRTDNTETSVSVVNTSDNYVDVVFDDEVCTVAGLYACELRIMDGNGYDVGSKNFALVVQRDPFNGQVEVKSVGPADICTFTTSLPEPLVSLKADIKAVQESGTPSPSNPLAISGFSEVNITACGVNLFDGTKVSTTTTSNWAVAFSNNILTIEHKNTYSSGTPEIILPSYNGNVVISYITSGNEIDLYTNGMWARTLVNGLSFTMTSDNIYSLRFPNPSATITIYNNIQLELGSTPTDYHAYNGQTASIDLNGTRYGGVLDVTRGVLTVTHGYKSFSILNINDTYTEIDYAKIVKGTDNASNGNYEYHNELANIAPCFRNTTNYNSTENLGKIFTSATGDVYWLGISKGTTVDQARSMYADLKILYELATPFEVNLTPTQITAIAGQNNVFSDSGDVEVKYLDRKV